VIDTSKREIVYAHCVASNKPFGRAEGKSVRDRDAFRGSSWRIRPVHSAGWLPHNHGSVRSEAQGSHLHRGGRWPTIWTTGLRTKLCAEPIGDIEKLFRYWDQWAASGHLLRRFPQLA
jgi:hypothetical protein